MALEGRRAVGAMVQIYCKGLLSAEVNSICAEQRGCVWAFPVARLPLSRKRRWACRRHNMDIGGLKEAEKEEPLAWFHRIGDASFEAQATHLPTPLWPRMTSTANTTIESASVATAAIWRSFVYWIIIRRSLVSLVSCASKSALNQLVVVAWLPIGPAMPPVLWTFLRPWHGKVQTRAWPLAPTSMLPDLA